MAELQRLVVRSEEASCCLPQSLGGGGYGGLAGSIVGHSCGSGANGGKNLRQVSKYLFCSVECPGLHTLLWVHLVGSWLCSCNNNKTRHKKKIQVVFIYFFFSF